MKTRLISLLMAVLIMLTSFAGCGETAEEPQAETPSGEEAQEQEPGEEEPEQKEAFVPGEDWAEDYFNNVISKLNDEWHAKCVIGNIFEWVCENGHKRPIDATYIFGTYAGCYYDFNGMDYGEYFESKKDYYYEEVLETNEELTEKDKEEIRKFYSVGGFPEEHITKNLEAALDFFYGKGTYSADDITEGEGLYITEDGESIFLAVGGIGGLMPPSVYYRLKTVEYNGNEAILGFNIVSMDSIFDGSIYDCVTGEYFGTGYMDGLWEITENEKGFEYVCDEGNIDPAELGIAMLRIAYDENGVYMVNLETPVARFEK